LYFATAYGNPPRRPDVARASLKDVGTVQRLAPSTFVPPRDFYFSGAAFALTDRHLFMIARRGGSEAGKGSGGLLYAVPLP
jgi:hypothetical protein